MSSPEDLESFASLTTRTHLDGSLAIYGAGLLLPVLVVGVLALRWRRERRVVEGTALTQETLAPSAGPVILRGLVRTTEPGDEAVRVTVEQKGVTRWKRSKDGRTRLYTTTWDEVARRVDARPFELEQANGARVRVEPGSVVHLMAPLGDWNRVGAAGRTATSSVRDGDEVTAVGRLVPAQSPTRGYRGGASLVLRERGNALLIAKEGLADAAQERARHHMWWMRVALVGVVLVQLFALPYHLARFAAEVRTAVVETARIERRKAKYGHFDVLKITYRVDGGGATLEGEADAEYASTLQPGRRFPVRVAAFGTTLGPRPTAYAALVLLPSGLLALFVVLALFWRAPRRWHETKLHHEEPGKLDPD